MASEHAPRPARTGHRTGLTPRRAGRRRSRGTWSRSSPYGASAAAGPRADEVGAAGHEVRALRRARRPGAGAGPGCARPRRRPAGRRRRRPAAAPVPVERAQRHGQRLLAGGAARSPARGTTHGHGRARSGRQAGAALGPAPARSRRDPPRVRIRRRKPCFFFRFRLFGWNVLFTHGLLERPGRGSGPWGRRGTAIGHALRIAASRPCGRACDGAVYGRRRRWRNNPVASATVRRVGDRSPAAAFSGRATVWTDAHRTGACGRSRRRW